MIKFNDFVNSHKARLLCNMENSPLEKVTYKACLKLEELRNEFLKSLKFIPNAIEGLKVNLEHEPILGSGLSVHPLEQAIWESNIFITQITNQEEHVENLLEAVEEERNSKKETDSEVPYLSIRQLEEIDFRALNHGNVSTNETVLLVNEIFRCWKRLGYKYELSERIYTRTSGIDD